MFRVLFGVHLSAASSCSNSPEVLGESTLDPSNMLLVDPYGPWPPRCSEYTPCYNGACQADEASLQLTSVHLWRLPTLLNRRKGKLPPRKGFCSYVCSHHFPWATWGWFKKPVFVVLLSNQLFAAKPAKKNNPFQVIFLPHAFSVPMLLCITIPGYRPELICEDRVHQLKHNAPSIERHSVYRKFNVWNSILSWKLCSAHATIHSS